MTRICMVTGATNGMGLETAQALASQGDIVVMVGRDEQKGQDSVVKVKETSGNERVEFLKADLSSLSQIRELAASFQKKYETLDVLVNNAGATFSKRQETVDGLEMTFALNHLGYFLLSNLLVDSLKASNGGRVINVASSLHKMVKELDLEDLQLQEKYSGFRAYNQSKLCNILFTYEFARRLNGSNVSVNAVCPGWVNTGLGKEDTFSSKLLRIPVKLFAKPVHKGAETAIFLSTSPELTGVTGKYFVDKKETRSSDLSYNQGLQKALWEKSWEICG